MPDRLEQLPALPGGQLGLRQRAEVVVAAVRQVRPRGQRRRLAVADKGLAAAAEDGLHLLHLGDVQRVVGLVARRDERGHRQPQRVERGHGDLDLRLVVAILAVPELEVGLGRTNIDVGVGGRGVDAKEVGLEVVDADERLVDFGFAVLPGRRAR